MFGCVREHDLFSHRPSLVLPPQWVSLDVDLFVTCLTTMVARAGPRTLWSTWLPIS